MRASTLLLSWTLLSISLFLPRTGLSQCSIPVNYTNRATVQEGNLLVTLATDEAAYVVGTS